MWEERVHIYYNSRALNNHSCNNANMPHQHHANQLGQNNGALRCCENSC